MQPVLQGVVCEGADASHWAILQDRKCNIGRHSHLVPYPLLMAWKAVTRPGPSSVSLVGLAGPGGAL
jgi:hypothetical protein